MKRRGKLAIILVLVLLAALLLISSTDLVLAEKQSAVYSISVLVPDATDECWVNFRKGMDQASIAYNADLSFVTLYERGQAAQQQSLAQREVENGAQALIVAPADSEMLATFLAETGLGAPVVSLYSRADSPQIKAAISADWHTIGGSLAEAVKEDLAGTDPGQPRPGVVAVSFAGVRDSVEETYSGFADSLSDGGYMLRREMLDDAHDVAALLADDGIAAVVALEPAMFQLLTEELGSQENPDTRLYGVGCTNLLLRELESGLVRAAAVCGDYDAGYLSVQTAVELLSGQSVGDRTVRHALVRTGELYSKEHEMLLFPIS